jgi:hypothetical protein
MKKYILLAAVFILGTVAASAQNMSGTVVTKEIKFAKGKHQASVPGSAKYGRSYVYTLGAKAGQTMDVSVTAKNRELTFSVIGPDDETLEGAFGVTEWSGTLPANGKYQVVVVMNDENAGSVPFTLKAKIK